MPLHTIQSVQLAQLSNPTPDPKFLIFFASGEPSWCPDCRLVLPTLEKVFGTSSASHASESEREKQQPHAYKILVGDKPTWRDPANHFRTSYSVRSVPTIIKWSRGEEVARIEDENVIADLQKLTAFVSS